MAGLKEWFINELNFDHVEFEVSTGHLGEITQKSDHVFSGMNTLHSSLQCST